MTRQGVIDELRERHAYAMIVRAGTRAKTSRHPGPLRGDIEVRGVPASCARGATFMVEVHVTNTGDSLWYHTPSALGGFVTVGCKLTTPSGRVVDSVLGRTLLPQDVAPGESLIVHGLVAVPAALAPAEYRLQFDLIDELVCWFSDVGGNEAGPSFPMSVT